MFRQMLATIRAFFAIRFTRFQAKPVARRRKRFVVSPGKRVAHTILIAALLFNQVLASPLVIEGLIQTGAAWQQEATFRWHAGGWGTFWQKTAAEKPETQADRDARVSKIRISPEEITAKAGQQINFHAIATDYDGNAITGVKFDWAANDEGRKEPARITAQGEFISLVPGNFKVTAYALGQQAQVTINVVGEPFKKRKPEEIPATVVSSRELPPVKSDTSLRFNQVSGSQIASLSTKPTKSRKALESGKPSFKAAANAFTPAAAFQAYGDPFGWTSLNFMSEDDCGKERGDMIGRPQDDGAGSGNHQFTAPILNLEGRGLDLGLALSYNARVWHKYNNEITFDIDQDWPAPGFSLGFGKITLAGLTNGYILIDGDGTRHGYQCEYNNNGYGMTCKTLDGSFIDYDVTFSTPYDTMPLNATAKLPNGTVITYGASATYAVYPTRITDPNGNYLKVTG